jgi:hypothetical protein
VREQKPNVVSASQRNYSTTLRFVRSETDIDIIVEISRPHVDDARGDKWIWDEQTNVWIRYHSGKWVTTAETVQDVINWFVSWDARLNKLRFHLNSIIHDLETGRMYPSDFDPDTLERLRNLDL